MNKPYTEQAAGLIAMTMRQRGVRALDPITIITFISLLLPLLMQFCQKPTPAQGYAHLTWRPYRFFDWFGNRLANHRRSIETEARSQWAGDSAGFRNVIDAMWNGIDEGRLTQDALAGMYAEHS